MAQTILHVNGTFGNSFQDGLDARQQPDSSSRVKQQHLYGYENHCRWGSSMGNIDGLIRFNF